MASGAVAERVVLHVDMDAFYAAVEVLHDPTLAGKPVIVGGSGSRGVVASCSYEARAYGIRSAMPSVQAKRLCPQAVFLPGRHGVYADYSRRLHEVFRELTPLVEPIALDEAFLDVSMLARRRRGGGAEVAGEIRGRVFDRLTLWCSVGVATSKLIAKLASKEAKPSVSVLRSNPSSIASHERTGVISVPPPGSSAPPGLVGARWAGNGVVVVDPGDELEFLHPLPVRALWGVGPATFERLARFGVETVGDLAALPLDTVVRVLGNAHGQTLHTLAWAKDTRPVEPDRPLKSVGHEETFAQDHYAEATLRVEALRMADAVGRRLRAGGHRGKTVSIKVRFADFRTITRARTLPSATDAGPEIYDTALGLLGESTLRERIAMIGVRLLGVAVSNLTDDAPEQLDLFSSSVSGRNDALSRTLDAVRERYGEGALGPAALASATGLRVKRAGDTQWGPNGLEQQVPASVPRTYGVVPD